MSEQSLFSIATEYKALAETLANLDIDEQTLIDTLDGNAGALEEKSTNIALAVLNFEHLADGIKQAEKRMSERRKAIEARVDRIKEYVKGCMELAGISKIESPEVILTIKKNPPAVEIYDEKALPDFYKREVIKIEPDKVMIKEELQAKKDVPGAQLVQKTRLDIK
jgi:aldehyde:ferredoxin oxidoreductase